MENDKIVEEPSLIHTVDNEDDLLYGDASVFQMPAPPQAKVQDAPTKRTPW